MYPYPTNPSILSKGLSLLKNISWTNLLDGTGKTLGVINQAIPIVYQVKPLFGNFKTVMKILGGINSNDTSSEKENTIIEEKKEENSSNKNTPIFYL